MPKPPTPSRPTTRALLLSSETRLQIHLAPHAAHGILPDIEKDFCWWGLKRRRIL